jgi:hypothetical protein
MDIPARIRILGAIQTGSVFYFEEEKLSSEEPHYFVVLNKHPRTEQLLILVCASSQIEKSKRRAKALRYVPLTQVFISPSEYPLFSRDTVIDCNYVFDKSHQSLIDKLEQGKLGVCTEIMDAEIVRKLKEGVIASPQIAEGIKKIIKD